MGEILGNLSVPAGTYTGANLTIGGNPGDVLLTASADPETGFAGTAGATIPSNQIDIQGQLAVQETYCPVSVNFVSPLVVPRTKAMRSISNLTSRIPRSSWATCQ